MSGWDWLTQAMNAGSTATTPAQMATTAAIDTGGQVTPPLRDPVGDAWNTIPSPGPWAGGYQFPDQKPGWGAQLWNNTPDAKTMWDMMSSPMGLLMMKKLMEKDQPPPAPGLLPQRQSSPFAVPQLSFSGGFQPLHVPSGGGGGGMGADQYDLLMQYLLRGRG